MVAPLPASKPASAAPAIKAFFDFVILLKFPVRKIVIYNISFNRTSTVKTAGD
jgi:hypothetical protein